MTPRLPRPHRNGGMPGLAACFALLLVAGCQPQSVRDGEPIRSAEDAARATITLEPGAPPAVRPESLPASPLRFAHRSGGTGDRSLENLRLADNVGELGNTWERMRAQFTLERPLNNRVRQELSWFATNQSYLRRMSERARMYLPYILRETEERGLPLELALLPVIESAYQPFAHSPASAAGIWQFIPSTGRIFGLKQNWWYDGRRDVVDSTRAALDYLEKLGKDFDGQWLLAVASYNWGEGNVARAVRRNRAAGKRTDFWSLRVPRETGTYIPRWLAVVEVIANPEKYDVELPPLPDVEYFEPVHVGTQIDLALAAEMAGIEMDEMYLLNAGFNRWATDPEGPHRLLLPVRSVEPFKARLAAMEPSARVRWAEHRVKKGQSLGGIAQRYRTSARALKVANELESNTIRPGQVLKVPKLPGTKVAAVNGRSDVIQARAAAVSAEGKRRRTHVVRKGDSLWRVARRYGVTVNQLAAWNGISRSAVLRPGRRLVVWGKVSKSRSKSSPAIRHVVKKGESLWRIAHRYQVSTKRLAAANGLRLKTVLQPGMRLRIPGGGDASSSAAG